MNFNDSLRLAAVVSPLIVLFVLGFFVHLPLGKFEALIVGIPFLAIGLLFEMYAYKITKTIVGKYGLERELNPLTRLSLARGSGDRDRRVLMLMILASSIISYLVSTNVWLFTSIGAFGTMFLDWFNDHMIFANLRTSQVVGRRINQGA